MKKLLCAAALVVGIGIAGVAAPADASVPRYPNCAALRRVYPHGVGLPGARDRVRGRTRPVTNFTRNAAVYRANSGRDADHDGVACERR